MLSTSSSSQNSQHLYLQRYHLVLLYISCLLDINSYTTPLCITHTIQILAAAAFLLSWRLLSPDIVPNLDTSDQEWKKYFNEIDWSNKDVMKEIEFVMNSIMDLWGKARNEKFKIGAEELKDVSLVRVKH